MFQINTLTRLFVAGTLCGALMVPVAAQAKDKGKRNETTKVVDATTLPARKLGHGAEKDSEKLAHGTKKDSKKLAHGTKKTVKKGARGTKKLGKSGARRVKHVVKQL